MRVSKGSIEQLDKNKPRNKCKRWRLWVTVDNKRRSKRFNGSVTDARAALDTWRGQLSESVSNRLTFARYAASYCDLREDSGRYTAATNRGFRTRINMVSRSPLGQMRMDEIRPTDIEAALLWVRDNPPRKQGRLSGASLNAYYSSLRTLFRHAELTEQISRDPMRGIQRPKNDTKEKDALTPLEIELLLNRLDGEPLSGEIIALYLMLCLGLRKGEALGLYRNDLCGNVAHVRRQLAGVGNEITPTKTACGVRALPMPARLVRKLQEWQEWREGWGIGDAVTVACNMQGGYLTHSQMQSYWSRNRARLGCEGLTLHQLRHSNLSMMARAVPSAFDLQRWAGWATIAPARIYVHTDLDALTAAVNSLSGQNAPKTHHSQENRW